MTNSVRQDWLPHGKWGDLKSTDLEVVDARMDELSFEEQVRLMLYRRS